jgi:hypothetical protein
MLPARAASVAPPRAEAAPSSAKPLWVTEFAQQREAALSAQRKREERERLEQVARSHAMASAAPSDIAEDS